MLKKDKNITNRKIAFIVPLYQKSIKKYCNTNQELVLLKKWIAICVVHEDFETALELREIRNSVIKTKRIENGFKRNVGKKLKLIFLWNVRKFLRLFFS